LCYERKYEYFNRI